MLTYNFYVDFLNKITNYSKISIFCHINPDFDTLGSAYGLSEFIKLNFKDKIVSVVDINTVENLKQDIFSYSFAQKNDEDIQNSLGIVVDVASQHRILGGDKLDNCSEIIIIDHHPDNEEITCSKWIDPEYPACCQMIAELIQYLLKEHPQKFKMNEYIATYLYSGLITDTNRFLYESVTPETFLVASWLIKNNANRKLINDTLYLRSLEDAKRNAYFLDKVMQINDNGVGYLFVDKKYNELYGMQTFQNIVCIMESIKEIKIWTSCYYNELYDKWFCSLRSREYPVVEIATKYGGGGHRLAAGCRISDPDDFQKIINDLSQLINDYDNKKHN